jgi:hypothetical protein
MRLDLAQKELLSHHHVGHPAFEVHRDSRSGGRDGRSTQWRCGSFRFGMNGIALAQRGDDTTKNLRCAPAASALEHARVDRQQVNE